MSACEQLTAQASAGVAPALRAVDCVAGEMTAAAFSRLFGAHGALAPALTILLTLYIAFFAFSLLTGRSTLSISALTPRMMTLGLVLTFATSWIAYQGVLWNLAVGAPDQIAGVLMGTRGSATQIFADRIDIIFAAIGEISQLAGNGQGGGGEAEAAQAAAAGGSFTPSNVMWLGALLLLLGTVGVLVTARIALAVLLALGPVFVIFALFSSTRGLTAGWLRGVVLTAVTPLFVVVGGGITLELLVPVVAALGQSLDGINARAAMALFLIAAVHVALMAMVLKVAGTLVSGWQVFGLAGSGNGDAAATRSSVTGPAAGTATRATPVTAAPATASQSRRTSGLTPPAPAVASAGGYGSAAAGSGSGSTPVRRAAPAMVAAPASAMPVLPRPRARGVGSRFRAPSHQQAKERIR